jgi:hypothetical protein
MEIQRGDAPQELAGRSQCVRHLVGAGRRELLFDLPYRGGQTLDVRLHLLQLLRLRWILSRLEVDHVGPQLACDLSYPLHGGLER